MDDAPPPVRPGASGTPDPSAPAGFAGRGRHAPRRWRCGARGRRLPRARRCATVGSLASTIRRSQPPRWSGSARPATDSTTTRRRSSLGDRRPARRDAARRTRPGGTSRPRASAAATCPGPSRPTARPTGARRREDKAEIATRLGWLTKETGDARASAVLRQGSRATGRYLGQHDHHGGDGHRVADRAVVGAKAKPLVRAFQLDKAAVAQGEYWRLWTVTLLHGSLLHLFFNMYALYLVGPIVERWYGSIRFLLFYLTLRRRGLGRQLRLRRRSAVRRRFWGDLRAVRHAAGGRPVAPPGRPPEPGARRARSAC